MSNEIAIRQIDELIRHGAKMPLNVYVMLREAEAKGFEISVSQHASWSEDTPKFNISVFIRQLPNTPARRLTAKEAKYTTALGFDSRKRSQHYRKAGKNSSNTVWYSSIPVYSHTKTMEVVRLEMKLYQIEKDTRKEIDERERLEEERERLSERDE